MIRRYLILLLLPLLLAACATNSVDMSKGTYKVGKPYVINGKKYYPEVDYGYSETGIASWYGPGFNGKKTANGERFNSSELTAAHRTLPMPSIVRVTNLGNGKSVMVRINDRGPFSRNRIIDVSARGAELLGFKNQGTAKVRVDILEKESKKIADAAMSGQDTSRMDFPQVQNASLENQKARSSINLKTKNKYVVSGHLAEGNFYPDHVVSQEKVHPTHVFVQIGAFSSLQNAEKLAHSISHMGQAQIKPVFVDGQTFFRVRLPVKGDGVDAADHLLEDVMHSGFRNAMIVVD